MRWRVDKQYEFLPSGDAEVIRIKIEGSAKPGEAEEWYKRIYRRDPATQTPPLHGKAYKAVVLKGGQDADIKHRRGDVYYVWEQDEPYVGLMSHYEY